MRSSGFAFEDLMRGSFGDLTDHSGCDMIDLNLGKRACLENSWSGGSEKSSSSVISTTFTTATERMTQPSVIRRCQVEGCNLDLSWAKDYHIKNRVCDYHSKSSVVVMKGLMRRFCQQCSRFHCLSEFDQMKRSCRRGLSAHNARRRKAQQEKVAFNYSSFPNSSCFDGIKQMNFLLNNRGRTRNAASLDFENIYNSEFSMAKRQQMNGDLVSYPISMHINPSNWFLAPKGTAASSVRNTQRFEDANSANEGELPDIHRALSPLSTNSWYSREPVSTPFDNNMHGSRMNMSQTPIHAVPLSSFPPLEYRLDGQPSTYTPVHSLTLDSRGSGLKEGSQFPSTSYGVDSCFGPLHY